MTHFNEDIIFLNIRQVFRQENGPRMPMPVGDEQSSYLKVSSQFAVGSVGHPTINSS
jgi:hypothetical protein